MIYSLLSLAAPGDRSCVPLNYQMDVFKLYNLVTRWCIHKTGRLDILRAGGTKPESTFDKDVETSRPPSWLPRWDRTFDPDLPNALPTWHEHYQSAGIVHWRNGTPYWASRNQQAQVWGQEDNDKDLILPGIALNDTVSWCSTVHQDQVNTGHPRTAIRDLWLDILRCSLFIDRPNGFGSLDSQEYLDKLARPFYNAISAGLTPEGDPIAPDAQLADLYRLLSRRLDRPNHVGPERVRLPVQRAFYEKFGKGGDETRVLPRFSQRKLFVTKNGHVGLGASRVREVDDLGILFGGRAPFALIAIVVSPHAAKNFQLIGEVYLYGFMEGHEIQKWRRGELQSEWITLR